jgi:hypothetical protein
MRPDETSSPSAIILASMVLLSSLAETAIPAPRRLGKGDYRLLPEGWNAHFQKEYFSCNHRSVITFTKWMYKEDSDNRCWTMTSYQHPF